MGNSGTKEQDVSAASLLEKFEQELKGLLHKYDLLLIAEIVWTQDHDPNEGGHLTSDYYLAQSSPVRWKVTIEAGQK